MSTTNTLKKVEFNEQFIGIRRQPFVLTLPICSFFKSLSNEKNKYLRSFFFKFQTGLKSDDKNSEEGILIEKLKMNADNFLLPLFPQGALEKYPNILKVPFIADLVNCQRILDTFIKNKLEKSGLNYSTVIEKANKRQLISLAHDLTVSFKPQTEQVSEIKFRKHYAKRKKLAGELVIPLFKIKPEFVNLWIKPEEDQDLLELFVYYLVHKRYSSKWDVFWRVDIHSKLEENNLRYGEIDILMINKADKTKIIPLECKSKNKPHACFKFYGLFSSLGLSGGIYIVKESLSPELQLLNNDLTTLISIGNIYDNPSEFRGRLYSAINKLIALV